MPQPIGILGGTFDPIHHGHLRAALELLHTLHFAQVRFIPVGHTPAHRAKPCASGTQRLALVRHAIADQPNFIVDERELHRNGPSYMIDTLEALRSEVGSSAPLCLLVGQDAFAAFHTWYRFQDLLTQAHLVVMQRPGALCVWPPVLQKLLEVHQIDTPEPLHRVPSGGILFQAVTQLDISATHIRALLAAGQSPRYLLPDAVLASIDAQGLYRT